MSTPEHITAEDIAKEAPLPVGHPAAGYVSPDLSFQDGTGELPPEEQEAHDEQVAAQQAEAAAVIEAEQAFIASEGEEVTPTEEAAPKAKAPKSTPSE